MRTHHTTHDGPTPGDPRHPGPRPAATWRDLAWGTLAGTIATITLVQVIGLTVTLLRSGVQPTVGGVLLGFVITVVWWLTIHWLVLGAWRRSVWGCPFPHAGDDLGDAAATCPRHGRVSAQRPDPTTRLGPDPTTRRGPDPTTRR